MAYADRHGLRIDREVMEQPGDDFVDRLNSDWRCAPLADHPAGKQLCGQLQPGDEVIVWQLMLEPAQLLSLAVVVRPGRVVKRAAVSPLTGGAGQGVGGQQHELRELVVGPTRPLAAPILLTKPLGSAAARKPPTAAAASPHAN